MPDNVDLLWQPHFRESLCNCQPCKAMYERAGAGWIVDPSDTPGAVAVDGGNVDKADAVLDETSDGEIVNDVRLESEGELEAKRARRASEADIQRDIQDRISDFLQRCVESNGRNMTHGSVREYLADVKSEVLSNIQKESGDN